MPDPGVALISWRRHALQSECVHGSVRGRRQTVTSAASSHSNVSVQMEHSGGPMVAAAWEDDEDEDEAAAGEGAGAAIAAAVAAVVTAGVAG